MALAELQSEPIWILNIIGTSILFGRLAHAYGVNAEQGGPRVLGLVFTFAALISDALANLGLPSLASVITG